MKIESLNTKIYYLNNSSDDHAQKADNVSSDPIINTKNKDEGDVQLINLSAENEEPKNHTWLNEVSSNDIAILYSKIEKMEQLIYKYKESLKNSKEKNAQTAMDLQKVSSELESKIKENDQLKAAETQLSEERQKIEQLNIIIEELQNKVNTYDFTKSKEMSTLEIDFQKAQEEIVQLRSRIEIFSKREEEYAISLAENKLSIHKELESKETEIKSLKDKLSGMNNELQSLNIILDNYKTNVAALEEERSKLNNEINQLNSFKSKLAETESQLHVLNQKLHTSEQSKIKAEEEIKCLQLQIKQETAEKLAMIDRNDYLENKNTLLVEENSKKSIQITQLENELGLVKQNSSDLDKSAQKQMLDEIEFWKAKFSNLESEIQDEREELVKLQSEIEKLLTNHELVQRQNVELHAIVSNLESENTLLKQKVMSTAKKMAICKTMASEVKDLQRDINYISQEARTFKKEINNGLLPDMIQNINALNNFSDSYDAMKTKYLKLEKDHGTLQTAEENVTKQLKHHSEELDALKAENSNLVSQLQATVTENYSLQQEVKNLTNKCSLGTDELNSVKNDKQNLIVKLDELESKYQHLQTAIDQENNQYLVALDKLKVFQDEKQTLIKKIDKIEKENDLINNEVEKLKIKHKDDVSQINTLNSEKERLQQESKEKELLVQKLNERVKVLSEENTLLNNKCESIANSVKNLESEINEVRKSHADIEIEKDRLSSIIETLEKKEQDKQLSNIHKDIQTEINVQSNIGSEDVKDHTNQNEQIILLLNDIDLLNARNSKYEDELKSLKATHLQLSTEIKDLNENTAKNTNDHLEKYHILQNEYDLLKEENRRLLSDIEGLQTYLAKISKENGVLNDKLRELIASSENTARNDYQSNELIELQNEVVADKERIEDLTRENTLLVEENLELKDQIELQTYADAKKSTNNNENDAITMDKYNNLLEIKNKLEEKLVNLEQMNKSINGNMQQIQGNNEKLRLTNDKLERRLDEALVSLRHLHSLQENTELEYLKNILYEYLTGAGTHSITLAKVLSAVVKFDDKQTQQVLQKEKERQGLVSLLIVNYVLILN